MTQTTRDGSNLTRTLNNSRFVENKHGETSPCRTFKSYNEHAVQISCVFFKGFYIWSKNQSLRLLSYADITRKTPF